MTATDSPWIKIVALDPPSLQDNTADADRLHSALKQILQTDAIDIDLNLLKQLPALLRQWDYRVRCIVMKDRHRWIVAGITDAAEDGFVTVSS